MPLSISEILITFSSLSMLSASLSKIMLCITRSSYLFRSIPSNSLTHLDFFGIDSICPEPIFEFLFFLNSLISSSSPNIFGMLHLIELNSDCSKLYSIMISFCFNIMLFNARRFFYGNLNCFKNYGILSSGR